MVVESPRAAMNNARRTLYCQPGMCLKYVRTWLGIAPKEATAYEAWLHAQHRHPGDRTPPNAAPMFFKGRPAAGHITLGLVINGKQRSTDWPRSGIVSSARISEIERAWGQEYLGWTEDLNGIWIPWLKGKH